MSKKNKFIAFPPITKPESDLFKSFIYQIFKIDIPNDFIKLLQQSNGFMVNNLIVYGTKKLKRAEYSSIDLAQANKVLTNNQIIDKIIIGKYLDNFIIYNKQGFYSINNPTSLDIQKKYKNIESLIKNIKEITQ